MRGIFCRLPFAARKAGAALLLFASALSSAQQLNLSGEKLAVLKVGSEVYSNVTVTAVTATDIYFTYSGGMGNVKLESLDPRLQEKFHFDSKKASQQESEEKKINANFLSWIGRQTNKTPASSPLQLDPYISVETTDATIEYKYYNPILDVPEHLYDGGMARIDCSFNIDADFTVYPVSGSDKKRSGFQIDTVKVSIEMPMTITMPATPTELLKNHVEGHKQIYEYFYALGPKAAERAARVAALRTTVSAKTTDQDSREAQFQKMAKRAAEMEYWKYTKYPAAEATRYYDNLTDYGMNLTDSSQAAQEAIQHCEVPIPDGSADTAPANGSENR
jgi:hypothetical protein